MRDRRRTRDLLVAALVALVCPSGLLAATAGGSRFAAEIADARIDEGPEGRVETLSISSALASNLLNVAVEGSARIDGWPVAPGVRRSIVVTRHDVYDPEARLVVTEADRLVDVPRSPLVFLWGSVLGGSGGSVLLSIDPRGGTFEGRFETENGTYRLAPTQVGLHALTPSLASTEGTCETGCGPMDAARAEAAPAQIPAAIASLHTATIAIDTDNELLLKKFANNTSTAADYLAQLVAGMSVMYERDLLIRLRQGFTVLRVSTTADPYLQIPNPDGRANSNQLNELNTYWTTNYGAVKRALVTMISGKQPNATTSGVSNVDKLCTPGPTGGYTFDQVYTSPARPAADDVREVGHEIGHVFGTRHTNCYAPPADLCFTGESGACYIGPTSCPAPVTMAGIPNVQGTVMSLCDRPGAVLNCPVANVFHPASVAIINPKIDDAVGACIFPFSAGTPAPVVSSISPSMGRTAGGTAVTLTGTGFQAGASAHFADLVGSFALTSVSFVNSTTLTGTTPAHGVGVLSLTVSNPDQQSSTLGGAFTYRPDPAITATSPATGSHLGGTPITITGTNFVSPATVTLGGAAATGVTVASPTSITATTAGRLPGAVDVVVSSPGDLNATSTSGFTYVPPTLTSINPNGGSAAGGTPITIMGSGFSAPATVTLGGAPATVVTVVDQGTLTAVTGAHAAGIVNASVGLPLGLTLNRANGFFYSPVIPPVAFYSLPPCRLVDTRNPVSPSGLGGPALVAAAVRIFQFNGECGLPPTAKAFSVNLTVVQPSNPGYLTLYPADGLAPLASNVNYSPGQTRANNAVLLLATDGSARLAVFNGSGGTTHFLLDVNGYFE